MAGVHRLTAAALKRKKPGHYGDGLGLWLQISPAKDGGHNRSWVFRYTVHGRVREMGLGRTLDVDLADARDRAKQQRRLLLDGLDPIEHRRSQRAAQAAAARRALSFDEATRAFIHTKNAEGRSRKPAGEWVRTLTRDRSPVNGTLA